MGYHTMRDVGELFQAAVCVRKVVCWAMQMFPYDSVPLVVVMSPGGRVTVPFSAAL